MTRILKLQLTFNEIEYPASLAPLLELAPHYRSRFCKQILEMYFREVAGTGGIWPTPGGASRPVNVNANGTPASVSVPDQDAGDKIGSEMFADSFASYFK
ncbi:hypothetical protein [Paraburkholderia terrae]|uniref:Uncharacterized protein n=1 Tax=Paraburkholderia terrae TaxID=311230 RepID=A0ABN6JWR6_9BURK|nr:hypothetical protein [Paraburkholderia terrae]BCZ85200.1 hypothetical protein PTKU64_88750 [Paraburkholderia terrae]BCZ85283.1 hypothetical protein PTKU64_89580 [Paraburkholderia terrae]BDC45585.1 hypothetical protein PTKU15_88820 [Paraburkholderia terrae]